MATSIGMAVTGTIVAAALSAPLAGIATSPADVHSFENAVTTATFASAVICTALVLWAAQRDLRDSKGLEP
ncbi:hypothetical protein [Kineosporia babensis]|uniref:Uncharacterized protein n=1 Tax=Kineosporia babensis TaxID=499548 RepID=A0A9X1NDH3_9ACTN|nr:hypothetical protein [Kineosporia babensis]MCD5312095.1 hypothetical protein [Kineosporia babensis]